MERYVMSKEVCLFQGRIWPKRDYDIRGWIPVTEQGLTALCAQRPTLSHWDFEKKSFNARSTGMRQEPMLSQSPQSESYGRF